MRSSPTKERSESTMLYLVGLSSAVPFSTPISNSSFTCTLFFSFPLIKISPYPFFFSISVIYSLGYHDMINVRGFADEIVRGESIMIHDFDNEFVIGAGARKLCSPSQFIIPCRISTSIFFI